MMQGVNQNLELQICVPYMHTMFHSRVQKMMRGSNKSIANFI